MPNCVLNSHDLREAILHYFISKKTAAESHRILVKVYGRHALSETTCIDWFWRFKSDDFNLSNEDHGKPPKKCEGAELQAFLDKELTQTLKQLAKALGVDQKTISRRLHAIGKIQKEGKWVPYELKERDIEGWKSTCKIFFDRFKRKSDYYLFRSIQYGLSEQHFNCYEGVKNWIDEWLASKDEPWY